MEEPHLIMSPLCRHVDSSGSRIRVEIYRLETTDWTLEVVDEHGNSTVWQDEFSTDDLALEEFRRALGEEGVGSFLGDSN